MSAMAFSGTRDPVGERASRRDDVGDSSTGRGSLAIRQPPGGPSGGRDAHYRLLYEKEPRFRQLAKEDPEFAAM